jgi:hypothetical protein
VLPDEHAAMPDCDCMSQTSNTATQAPGKIARPKRPLAGLKRTRRPTLMCGTLIQTVSEGVLGAA